METKIWVLLFFFFNISVIEAQEIKDKDRETEKKENSTKTEKVDAVQTAGDKVQFKNSSGNPILTITDEDDDQGSITLSKMESNLTSFDNKLYNVLGTLYFNGIALGTGSVNDNDWEVNGNELLLYDPTNQFVGIGTISTETTTKLHVKGDNGVLFQGTQGNGLSLNLGAGTRFHFYPKKSAIRGGYADGTQWDDANIGDYSTAFGQNTTASGNSSTAFGFESTSSGNSSVALGYRNTSSGNRSMAIGSESSSEAFASFSIGRFNVGGGNAGSWVDSDPLFEIGIGTSTSDLLNALTVLKNGNVGIGTATPGVKLQLRGTATENPFSVQINTADKLKVFSNGGTSFGTAATPPANGLLISGTLKASKEIETNNINSISSEVSINSNVNISSSNTEFTGTAQFGVNGVQISEIVEITGDLTNSNYTSINYPSCFNNNNTRILSCEVQDFGVWYS